MRQVDSTQNRLEQLSRRRYAQILAGASVASLAGCLGGDDEGNGNGNGGDDDTGTGNGGRGDPQRETLRVHVNNVPEQSNFNPWAATVRAEGGRYWEELTGPYHIFTNEKKLDGHTWDATWIDDVDEISIPTVYTGYDVEPPYDVWDYFNEELTYWDGETPIDAYAKEYEDRLYFFNDDHHFNDEATFNYEAEDQWTYHWWQDKGEVEGQTPRPRTEAILEQDAAPTHNAPPHPDFTRPYVEEFEDVGTEDESDELNEQLAGESISLYDLAEKGWGSGLYRLDPEQISEERAIGEKRDDHPNEHATVPEVEFQFADSDRRSALANNGNIDLGWGIVQEAEGDINRQRLPDHLQELDRYLSNGGDHLLFNWKNEHLQNLWVRRAIVAAVDWHAVGANGWGPERSTPNEHHICMIDSVAEAHLDEGFLDQLYQYPIEQDLELATQWMENAGYSGDPESGWESPEGVELTITLDVNTDQADWIGASETIETQLEQLGMTIDYVGMDWPSWEQRYHADNNVYDMGIFWTPGASPWEYYEANGQWWTQPIIGGDPESAWPGDVDWQDYSEADNHGRPFEQEIPTEVGNIDAPNEAGRKPSLSNGELISLPELSEALRNPEVGVDYQEAVEKLAWYSNFYVPQFTFHNYTWGTWGNVRDFSFPERGHDAHYVWKEFSSENYHTLSGVVQLKYDDEY